MNTRSRAARAALTVVGLLAGLLVAAAPASAQPAGCLPDVGKKVPVLFVHGLLGYSRDWRPLQDLVAREVKEAAPSVFGYEAYNTRWVTDPHIGRALADRVNCMAVSSREQGGQGKVVVAAHSMGGLATRQAIAESPDVAKALGLVITIATPNTGSSFDRTAAELALSLCRLSAGQGQALQCLGALGALDRGFTALPALKVGSKELRDLPAWPRSVPVFAIAGNIRPHYNIFGWEFDGPPSGSDTLVTTGSALHSVKVSGLGGIEEFGCSGGPPPVLPNWTRGDCEHGTLVHYKKVQDRVISLLKAYQTAAQPQRRLPETCNETAFYQGSGYTLKASVTVLSGTVTCNNAVKLAQSYLEQKGPKDPTTVGPWTCRVTSTGPQGFTTECNGPEGKVRLNGE